MMSFHMEKNPFVILFILPVMLFHTFNPLHVLLHILSGETIRTYTGHHKAVVCCALNDSAIDGRDMDS